MTLQHAEREHSEHGASSCKRWWNCPGCIALSRGIPNKESVHAAEGTAAHTLAELCLTNGQDAEEYVGRTVAGFNVDAEMAEAVGVYLKQCRDILKWGPGGVQHQVEARFNLALIDPPAPMYGTADFVAWADGWLWVVDLKYGRGVSVEAEGNPQLKYYALGAMLALPPGTRLKYVSAIIVQPRAPDGRTIRTVQLDPVEVVEWSIELMDRARATLEPGAPLNPGAWCQFCPAAGKCPAQAAAGLAAAQLEFGVLEPEPVGWTGAKCGGCGGHGEREGPFGRQACGGCGGTGEEYSSALKPPTLPDAKLLTPEQRAAALHLLPQLEDFARDLRAAAMDDLQRGVALPGWKLVPTRPTQSWRDEAEAAEILDMVHELAEAERFAPRELVSPAKVRDVLASRAYDAAKALPKADRITRDQAKASAAAALAPLIRTASSGVKLAPAADSTPGLPAPGSEFTALPPANESNSTNGSESHAHA